VTFIIAPYKYMYSYLLTYLLTNEFLVNKYLSQIYGKTRVNRQIQSIATGSTEHKYTKTNLPHQYRWA